MKRIIVTIAVILSFIGIYLSVNLDRDQKDIVDRDIPILTKFYENTKIKKTQKEIERKIYSKTFQKTIKDLELKKLEAVNYLVGRDSLSASLNSGNRVEELRKIEKPTITSREAEEIFLVSKELTELGSITPELKNYLKGEYKGFDYENFAKKGDSILSYIRNKELIKALLPKTMGNIIVQIPPAKAEVVMGILGGQAIPNKVNYTTNDFIKLGLQYEEMEEVYDLAKKLHKLGEIEPKFITEANKLYLDLDYTRIAKYGDFYLQEKKSIDRIAKDYIPENYSFQKPFILTNPYGRVANMSFLIYPGVENDKVEITVKGREDEEDFTYTQEGKEHLTIYGLYLNGKPGRVILKRGDEKSELEIESFQMKDGLPVIKVEKKTSQSSRFFYMTYMDEKLPYGIGFDSVGRIRYLLDPATLTGENWNLKKSENEFILFNGDIVFKFSFEGKIIDSYSRWKYENEIGKLEGERTGDFSVKTSLHEENRKSLSTVPFTNEIYPKGQIVETLLVNGERIFLADIYLDRNSGRKNRILEGDILEFPPVD
ncbi:MAG: hypothetical protein ACRCTS_09910 [Fusobacteriaceae bacterium]